MSKTTSDVTSGVVELHNVDVDASDLRTKARRITRVKTLDGGVVITDSGFSDGDRTIRIVERDVGETLADAIETLHQNNAIINLSMPDGFYSAAIKSVNISKGTATIVVFIKQKLSA